MTPNRLTPYQQARFQQTLSKRRLSIIKTYLKTEIENSLSNYELQTILHAALDQICYLIDNWSRYYPEPTSEEAYADKRFKYQRMQGKHINLPKPNKHRKEQHHGS